MKGYVKLRRGILDHFKVMTASELKVYIGILLLANYKKGYVNITVAELSDIVALSYKVVQMAAHRLEKLGYVKFTVAKNQWQTSRFEIIKYNASVNSAEPTTEPTPEATTEPTPEAKVVSAGKTKGLQNPKKYKELKEIKEVLKNKDFSFFANVKFTQAFVDYLTMRKTIKRKATPKAQELVLKDLHKYDIKTAIAMLEQSIVNSWQGVFPLKTPLPKKDDFVNT